MRRARFLDLQHSLSGFGCELPDELQFGVSERNHFVILIDQLGNWTTSVRDPGHKRHNWLCFENVQEAIDGRAKVPHPKQRFQRAGRRFAPGYDSSALVMFTLGGRGGLTR